MQRISLHCREEIPCFAISVSYTHLLEHPWRVGGKAIGGILRVGSPIALQDFLTSRSVLIITSIVNGLGLIASAAVGIAEKLYVFLSIVPMAFMSALSTSCV